MYYLSMSQLAVGTSACWPVCLHTQLTGLTSAHAASCPNRCHGKHGEEWAWIIALGGWNYRAVNRSDQDPKPAQFHSFWRSPFIYDCSFYVALSFHMCSENTWVNSGPSSSITITGFILHCCQRYYTNFKLKKWDRQWIQRSCPNLRISQWVCHCLAGNKHLWTSNIVCL